MKELCTCTTAASSINKGLMVGMLAVTTGLIFASASFAGGKGADQSSNRQASHVNPNAGVNTLTDKGPVANSRNPQQKGAQILHKDPGHLTGGIAGGPPNDDCALRIAIFDGVTGFDTTGASTDGPPASCVAIGQDIWFNYTATQTGTLNISLCGSAYDTAIALYAGCACPPGAELACNDDFCGLQSQTSAAVTAGNCYKLRVGGFALNSGTGTINLTYAATNPPPNNDCINRIDVFEGDTPFSTELATTDGPPTACIDVAGSPQVNQDVWFNFDSLIDSDYTVTTCGSAYDTKIAIYDGCVCPPGADIACNDDALVGPCAGTLQSTAVFTGVAGHCYKIRVGGFQTATGTGNLNISEGAPPPVCGDPNNHDCCTAGGPGCSDEKCCNTICAVDSFCCAVAWDAICVGEATSICGHCMPGFCPAPTFPACPNPEHDCATTGTPGCSDADCCNATCAADAFCCDTMWDAICVSEAASICGGGGSSCPQVSCPPGAVAEGEPCCDDTNGGCNSVPPIFGHLNCGQTVCGLQWAFGNIRDTDWYRFDTGGGLVTFTVNAEFPSIAFLASACCPASVLAVGAADCTSVASATLPAGSYLAIEVPAAFNGLPCGTGNNDYTGHLECTPPCIGDIDGNGSVGVSDLLSVIQHWGACP